jgi:hypothetical protein
MKQILVAALLVCLVLPTACTRGNESTQAAREAARMTNSDLEKKIEAQLNSDPYLRAARLNVSADADENRVTLWGTVESEELRTRAVEMARASHPGVIIEDKIEVTPPVPTP